MGRKPIRKIENIDIYQTENKHIKCTKLIECIRCKSYLGHSFNVYFDHDYVPEGTRVLIEAGNDNKYDAILKNNQTFVKNSCAEFNDLRFMTCSGRGRKFDIYIRVMTEPCSIQICYRNAIKVTVDGPRPSRKSKLFLKKNFFSLLKNY